MDVLCIRCLTIHRGVQWVWLNRHMMLMALNFIPCLLSLSLASLGKGCVYSFDPVGSYDRETYRAGGSASSMLQPLLDNQVCHKLPEILLPYPSSLTHPLSPSLDWSEESEWCGERTAVFGEGGSSSSRCVQCGRRERHLHRRWAGDQHHHSSRHTSETRSTT